MHRMLPMKSRQRGVTLLELMIVVVIIGIISSIAYPSYMQYVVSAKRTTAASALLRIADRQQQFFMDNKRYSADLTNLGFSANPLSLSDEGNSVPAGDLDAVYSISLSNVTAMTYTITAGPVNGQLERDTECGSLMLNQAGMKDNSAGGEGCW